AEPIWFSHIPDIVEQSMHDTNYLYCKMAHNGRTQWTLSTTDSSYKQQSQGSNNQEQQQQQQCTKCFCLPDTQRIGCVHTSCTEATTANTETGEQQLQKRLQPNLHTNKAMVNNNNVSKNNNDKYNAIINNKPIIYVNHEACVKAKQAITAAHRCKVCVCHQNGVLVCTNDVVNPACGYANMDKAANKRHSRPLLASVVRRDKDVLLPATRFSSFAECVRAHNGQSSFKQECNTCACSENGAVICTLMACMTSSPLPTSSAPSDPSNMSTRAATTNTTSSTCTSSTPQTNSIYQSYDQCVSANGGAHFKRE
ncbi:hypothetical protein FB639_006137, partial [Coemansia asiatica]